MPTKHKQSWRERAKAKATPAQLAVLRAKEAAKRRRQRFRTYFYREFGRFPEGPDDAKDVRRMMRGHPCQCLCFDCLYEPEVLEDRGPTPARSWERITAQAGKE